MLQKARFACEDGIGNSCFATCSSSSSTSFISLHKPGGRTRSTISFSLWLHIIISTSNTTFQCARARFDVILPVSLSICAKDIKYSKSPPYDFTSTHSSLAGLESSLLDFDYAYPETRIAKLWVGISSSHWLEVAGQFF